MLFTIALLVFVVVTLGVFAAVSLYDQRKAQARVLRDRLSTVQKPGEQTAPDMAFLRMKCSAAYPPSTPFCAALSASLFCRKCWRREASMLAPGTS